MSVITLQIGQCGNQLGYEFFNAVAQDIGAGEPEARRDLDYYSSSAERFFTTDTQGSLLSSAILIDTETKVVGKVLKEACNGNKWHYTRGACYTSAQGAGNNWALGYIEHSREALEQICDLVRRHIERRDWLDGFLPIFSLGGGTGSGLGTKLTETLRDSYPNTPVINAVVWPCKSGEVAVQAYNALLSLAHLQDSADGLLVLSNDALHRVATQRWALRNACLAEMNLLAARQLACLLQPSQGNHGLHTHFGALRCTRRCTHLRAPSVPGGNTEVALIRCNPLGALGDVASELGCHGALKQVGLLQVPQEPPAVATFSCCSWQGLVRALSKMQRCHSATDEAMGAEGKPPTCIASLAVARGEGLSALDVTDLAPHCASFVEPGRELNLWTHPHRFLGSGRTLLLASNSDACVPQLDSLVKRAWSLFTEAAYLHHYARHGLQAEDVFDAFVRVEQTIETYKGLSK